MLSSGGSSSIDNIRQPQLLGVKSDESVVSDCLSSATGKTSSESALDFRPAPDAITVHMECPGDKVGAIIGKKGANVNEIMRRSGCRIVIDNSDIRDGLPKRVNLTGPPERLAVAMSLVSLIIKDGANALIPPGAEDDAGSNGFGQFSMASRSFDDMANPIPQTSLADSRVITIETRCPLSKVGTLIGAKGTTISEIMRRSGCRVHIIQDPPLDGNVAERQVVFTGTEEQIEDARTLVGMVLSEGSIALRPAGLENMTLSNNGYGGKNVVSAEDDIEPDKVGVVIGVKGCVISEIMKRCGCRIVINQDFPPGLPHKIMYSGTPEQIDMARDLIDLVLTRGPAVVTDPNGATSPILVQEVDIYQSQTGKILGPQGSTIKDIQVKCGVKMTIQVSPAAQAGDATAINTMKITGTEEGIKLAISSVCRVLNGGTVDGSAPALSPSSRISLLGGGVNGSGASRYNDFSPNPGACLGLGVDGTAGILEPAVILPDGMHQQVAEIKNDMMGKVIGKSSGNITLIRAKSGANIQVMKTQDVDPLGSTRVTIVGVPADVALATQMVQEVLVNGPAKLLLMPDRSVSTQPQYRGMPSAPSNVLRPLSMPMPMSAPVSMQAPPMQAPPMPSMPMQSTAGVSSGASVASGGSGDSSSYHSFAPSVNSGYSRTSSLLGGGAGGINDFSTLRSAFVPPSSAPSSAQEGTLNEQIQRLSSGFSSAFSGENRGGGNGGGIQMGAHQEDVQERSYSATADFLGRAMSGLSRLGLGMGRSSSMTSSVDSGHGRSVSTGIGSSGFVSMSSQMTPQQYYNQTLASLKASEQLPQQFTGVSSQSGLMSYSKLNSGGAGTGAGAGAVLGSGFAGHQSGSSLDALQYELQLQEERDRMMRQTRSGSGSGHGQYDFDFGNH